MNSSIDSISRTQRLRHYVDNTFKTWHWWLLAVLSHIAFRVTMAWLEGLYKLTNHPVSVIEGQTTFSGPAIKSFYATMLEHGTLDQYVHVQMVDYGFMLTMFCALACATLAAYRTLPQGTWIKSFAWFIALVTPFAPLFDGLENVVSFFMLASPTNFADWLAYPYSTFAVIKYGLSGIGFVWAALCGVLGLFIGIFTAMRYLIRPINRRKVS